MMTSYLHERPDGWLMFERVKQSGELSVYLGICSNVPLHMQNSQTVGTC